MKLRKSIPIKRGRLTLLPEQISDHSVNTIAKDIVIVNRKGLTGQRNGERRSKNLPPNGYNWMAEACNKLTHVYGGKETLAENGSKFGWCKHEKQEKRDMFW